MNCESQLAGDIRKREYEVQLYGCPVNDVFLYLRNSLEGNFNQLVEDLKKTLHKRNGLKVEEISAALEGLMKLWEGASCGFYEELKEVVNQHFEIPSNVLLPEDKVHLLPCSAEDEKELDKKIKELTNQLESVRMMKQCLEQENLSLKKSLTLEKELSESSVLDSFDIDCHYYERTVPSNITRIMKIVKAIHVNSKEHN